MTPRRLLLLCLLGLPAGLPASPPRGTQAPAQVPAVGGQEQPTRKPADNPYLLQPFHADFPVELEYPPQSGLEYDRTRRQMLARLAANLQGNVRRETWLMATEFFWRAPEDAVEPLIEAMDRVFGNPALGDVVKNCVEAMGKMAREDFDGALQRAVEHKNPAVRQAAYRALATSGKVSTLRTMFAWFPQMDGASRTAWLRALRLRLGPDAVPLLRELMMAEYHSSVRDQVLRETLKLPPLAAAEILRGRWPEAVGEFKAIIAGVLHAAGDSAGTVWLRDALQSEDINLLGLGVRHSAFGEPGSLREPLLRASTHLRPEVRLEVAKVLTRFEGDDVADVYEVLLGPDEVWEVRAIALRELTRRGRPQVVTMLLEEVATATGTRLQLLLSQLAASGDERAVPVLLERFRKAPPTEGRPFLQALAQNQSKAAAAALFELFVGPEQMVARGGSGVFTTRNYIPTLLLNLRGVEREILALAAKIPPAEWRLRAAILPTLAGIAADRDDQELKAPCVQTLRQILFDRSELPQLRVLALNLMARRWLTIDDACKLKNTRHEETPAMRVLFTEFLNDCF